MSQIDPIKAYSVSVLGNLEIIHPTIEEPTTLRDEDSGHEETFSRAFNSENAAFIKSVSTLKDKTDDWRLYFTRTRERYELLKDGKVVRVTIDESDNDDYTYSVSREVAGTWDVEELEARGKRVIYERSGLGGMKVPVEMPTFVINQFEKDGVIHTFDSPYVKSLLCVDIQGVRDRNGNITNAKVKIPIYESSVEKVMNAFNKTQRQVERRMQVPTAEIRQNSRRKPQDGETFDESMHGKGWKKPVCKAHEGLLLDPRNLHIATQCRLAIFHREEAAPVD